MLIFKQKLYYFKINLCLFFLLVMNIIIKEVIFL